MQPDLSTRPWEKPGTDILELNGKKNSMAVDYHSRYPVIRLLNDITSHTVSNHFTSILTEYGLPTSIIADFGFQCTSERFKSKCGITLHCGSPCRHQPHSLAERAIRTSK